MGIKKGLLILTLFLVGLTLAACQSVNPEEQQPGSARPYTVWFSDPNEYRTSVLSVAQAETRFTIILPSYLPSDVDPNPHFGGPARNEFNDMTPVTIIYKKAGSDIISIDEVARNKVTSPDDGSIYNLPGYAGSRRKNYYPLF